MPCKIITVCQFAKTKGIYKWDEESHCMQLSFIIALIMTIRMNAVSFVHVTRKTWCRYQRDKITGESTDKSSINIPKNIIDLISPIFSHSDLGSDSQLERCLHGQTQNCNEALNQLI